MGEFQRAVSVCPRCDGVVQYMTKDQYAAVWAKPQCEWPRITCSREKCGYVGIANYRLHEGVAIDAVDAAAESDLRHRISADERDSAHAALDVWLNDVEIERPDYGMGEQATLRYRAGYSDGHCTITVRRSMEKGL